MDSVDVVDDVNALLKLGIGDPYRLEHIKQAYILNSSIWKSDKKWLEQLREKYLVKHSIEQHDVQSETDENLENDSEDKNMVHCWKCGKKSLLNANFCMICGSSLFEVGKESKTANVKKSSIRLKIPIMIGIPVLILIILGVGYNQGLFDNALERQVIEDVTIKQVDSNNSKCGGGTIFDENANSCVSKCGEGTIFDENANSCVLEK